MESRKTTISLGLEGLSDFGFLAKILNGQLQSVLKLIACVLFLFLGPSLLLTNVQAQGPGLYKGDKKILDFEEIIDTSFKVGRMTPIQRETAGMRFYQEVLGKDKPNQFKEQKKYLNIVLKCRDLVRRISSNYEPNSLSTTEIGQLLALEEDLTLANQTLLEEFDPIAENLKRDRYPQEKIDRHLEMVERHTIAANDLLDLLVDLRIALSSNDQLARENVIRELEQYFIDNVFKLDPPLLSSQPLPVMMYKKEAPVIQVGESPPAIPYPTLPKVYDAPSGGDLDSTIDIQFTDEIIALAESLNHSPVEIYGFVRENFEFEPYLGSRKGSQQTLDHRRGNDYDQASLLIALLRVSGIPARYATGTIKMTMDQATNWLGIEDKKNTGNILATAGMEAVIYIVGSDTVAISCKRVWVEVWVPFINYRGAVNDSTGFMWVPMDPSFKQYNYMPGINLLAEIGFDAGAFVDQYISTLHSETPIEMFGQMLLDSLAIYHPGASYDDLITTRTVIKENDGILPGTLPYELMEKDSTFSEIDSQKRYYIRFHLYGGGTDLDYTISSPEIVQKQVTISYVGATAADSVIIDTAGGIFNVDLPYLVDLKPVLKIDGCEVERGTGDVMMGTTHNSDMHFTAPTGASNPIPIVTNYIIAGNYQGIGIDTEDAFPEFFDVPQTSCDEQHLGQEVHQTALTYLNNVDVAGDELADLMHQVVINDVSEAIVGNTITVLFSGGMPQTFDWTGMIVDADRKIIGPFSVYGIDNDCDYMRIGGADGSIQENKLFEDRYGEEAISAIKILELASDSGIVICSLTYDTSDCPGIDHPSYVIDAILDCLAAGNIVIIPKTGFTYYNWTGTGWICLDPVTCAAGYIIAGGQGGGATVQEWDISMPDLFCIEPIGPITVAPSATGDLYCSENTARWTFTVPTIKYWGKDDEGNCQFLTSGSKDFPVKYTIKFIADNWGPGEYIFRCGSYTTECGCTMIEKTVTIIKPEITGVELLAIYCKTETMTALGTPSGGTFGNWTSSATGVATIDPNTGAITTVSNGATNITVEYTYSGKTCISAPYTVTVAVKTLSTMNTWNDGGTVQYNNNCYNYATDNQTNTFAQPGKASTGSGLSPPITCAKASQGATSDGLVPVTINDLGDPCGEVSQLSNGGHIVALIASGSGHVGDTDYHWYRMEDHGAWTHKPGGSPATNLDANGATITDPRTAAWASYYDEFCGFFYVGPSVNIQ